MNKFVFLLMLAFLPIVVNNRVCAASFNGTAPVTDALQPQDSTDEVTLMVSADGETKDEAVKTALRSAIEQAYGTFVSANTTILNDTLFIDEIVSVASGNIKEYKEMSAEILPNGRTAVMLQATVSISRLINYAQSKGAKTEFAGATFAMNVKMKELNRVNEEKTIENLLKQMDLLLDNGFDYTIETANPTIDGDYGIVEATVTATANANAYKAFDLLFMTLQNLSLKDEEVEEYKSLKLPVYNFYVGIEENEKSYGELSKRMKRKTTKKIMEEVIKSSEFTDSYELRSEKTLELLKNYFGTYYITKVLSFSVNTDLCNSQIKMVDVAPLDSDIRNDNGFWVIFPRVGFQIVEDIASNYYEVYGNNAPMPPTYHKYHVKRNNFIFKTDSRLLNYISGFKGFNKETGNRSKTVTNLIFSGDVYSSGGEDKSSMALIFSGGSRKDNIIHKMELLLKIPMEDFMKISKFTITPIKE